MVNSIQCLRAIAALMVLVFHAQQMLAILGYGQAFIGFEAGVDIFFVISGFIILLTTLKNNLSPLGFIIRRLIRIVPIYWFYTSLLVLLLLLTPDKINQLKIDAIPTLQSYFFLLSTNNLGHVGSLLFVGWSLAFELYFYMVFTLSLLLPKRMRMGFLSLIIVSGSILSFVIQNCPTYLRVVFSPLPLEFLAGCLLAHLHLKNRHFSTWQALAAIGIGVLGIVYVGFTGNLPSHLSVTRVEYFLMPAILFVYGLVSLESKQKVQFPKSILFLGDASYSIYLSHSLVLATIKKKFIDFEMNTWLSPSGLFILSLLATLIFGSLSFYLLEKPLTRWLTNRYKNSRSKTI